MRSAGSVILFDMPQVPARPSAISVLNSCTLLNALTESERMQLASKSNLA